jgi:hypothetical protein
VNLVTLRRTGPAVSTFDSSLDRGFDVPTGGEVCVSELAALELLTAGGWEQLDPTSADVCKNEE